MRFSKKLYNLAMANIKKNEELTNKFENIISNLREDLSAEISNSAMDLVDELVETNVNLHKLTK